MKKLAEWLCSFSSDKYVHYIVCLIGTLLVSKILVLLCHCPAYKGAVAAAIVFFFIGLFKEFFDTIYENLEKYDWHDVKADVFGLITGALLSFL